MSYRKPKSTAPAELATFECIVGFSSGSGDFQQGSTVEASHPVLRSPWRSRFVPIDATTMQRAAARAAVQAEKERANPERRPGPSRFKKVGAIVMPWRS